LLLRNAHGNIVFISLSTIPASDAPSTTRANRKQTRMICNEGGAAPWKR